MIINAENLIAGRLASFVAKRALLGDEVIIINSENAVISGKKENILGRFKERVYRGTPFKGPFQPKRADRILRRMIRGMLPYKQERGKSAFKRVMCYLDIPEEYKDKKIESIEGINISKIKKTKYLTLGKIAGELR